MTTDATPALLSRPPATSPFLVWPVSGREIYRNICMALLPALAWGVVLFGSRALAMLILSIAASSTTYLLLKRLLRWRRAQPLLYMHVLLSAMVLVALAHPTWPVWVVLTLAFLLPGLLAAIGGPGREPIHVAAAVALAAQYILLPALSEWTYTGKPDAVLARDRLIMGDIRNQVGDFTSRSQWPSSLELGGDDAVVYTMPAVTAADTIGHLAAAMPARGERPEAPGAGRLSPADQSRMRALLDRAFAQRLPPMDLFILGVAPNRIGAASLIALLFGGLYLSYRCVLRPRSVTYFLASYIVATMLLLFPFSDLNRSGFAVFWEVLKHYPGEVVTLFNFLLLNSDLAFAAVIILALPGSEPLTTRGRRMFLALAATAAAALHRLDPETPSATLALCVLMPLAPFFDRLITQRSWLNGPSAAVPSKAPNDSPDSGSQT